jgi:hypothetical protein
MKLPRSFAYVREIFVAIGSTELSSRMASYMTDKKVFVIETFYCLVVLVLLWRDNIIESFLLPHQETLPTGLLNSLKKQKVCV